MKKKWKELIIALAIPLAVGFIASRLTMDGFTAFESVNKPFLSPPAWLFPVAWTLLYLLMGYASFRVYDSVAPCEKKRQALVLYAIQLGFNFVWPLIFFNLEEYFFAFVWIIALWVLIFLTEKRFESIDKIAGYLLIPYLVWVAFAAYLNFGIWLLN
ncbi:MAG: tryptophan-rich sensory protein [Clostridia bacterium]|nr:tryptophan-rich sensory protein [Clostridia bacterium]